MTDVTTLLSKLETIVAEKSGTEECFYFRRCIRLLEQCLDYYIFDQGGRPRDRHMAENILALRDLYAQRRFVLTSGNWHISRVSIPIEGTDDYVTMGSILADVLGEKYCAIGTAFCEGTYLGVAGDSSTNDDVVVETHVPKSDTFEYSLNAFAKETASPNFMVDFRHNRLDIQPFPWPDTLRMNVGEAAPKQSYDATFLPQRSERQFDGLLYLTKTTPITVLPDYYLYSRKKWGK